MLGITVLFLFIATGSIAFAIAVVIVNNSRKQNPVLYVVSFTVVMAVISTAILFTPTYDTIKNFVG